MIELLNKLDKDTLIALVVALFRVHQPWNATGVIKSLLKEFEEERKTQNTN